MVSINDLDFPTVVRVQAKLLRKYTVLGSWRAVQKDLKLSNVRYVFEFALYGIVPKNPQVRRRLGLPVRLPSERSRKVRRVGSKVFEVRRTL